MSSAAPTPDAARTPGAARPGGGEPVFLEFGQLPDEAGAILRPGARDQYPDEVRERLESDARELLARYPQDRSALLPLLHLVQAEDTHLTPAGIEFCADMVGLSAAEVLGVATFYSMYRRTPTGEYLVGVCTNTLCAVMGGDEIYADLQEHLGLDGPGTTVDGQVTLDRIECNAACDYAPVLMINWEFFDDQTPESARRVVDDLRAGRTITPTRGAPLCGFRETSRVLAGFPDTRPGANDGAPGEATLTGLRTARERGMYAPAGPSNDRDADAEADTPGPDEEA